MDGNCLEVFVAPTDITSNNNSSTDADITIIANNMTDKLSPKLNPSMATKKKLTQARLSFKPLDAKPNKPVTASKKRKLSDQDTSLSKTAKIQKANIENKIKPHNNITNNNGINNNNNTNNNSDSSSISNVNKNNSSSIAEMEVCDEVISSSGSSSVATPMQQTVKSHTLDKFFSSRNVQDEIISSSTNDVIDLTRSDGDDNISEKCEENIEKENKLSSNFNEDANFALLTDPQAKPKSSLGNAKSSVLKEKFDQVVGRSGCEVKVFLPDLALCDMSVCSSPADSKLINSALSGSSCKSPLSSSSKSPKQCAKSLVLPTSAEQKDDDDDSSSELDLSTCATPCNEESSTTCSVASHSDEDVTPMENKEKPNPLASTPKTAQVKQKRRRIDPMRQKIKEEREKERLKRKEEKENERLQKLQQRKEDKERKSLERQHLKMQKDKERSEKEKQREMERLGKEKLKDELRRKKQDMIENQFCNTISGCLTVAVSWADVSNYITLYNLMRKQQRRKAAFQNYFVQKPKNKPVAKPKEHSGMFMPFEVKKDMRMAPADRRSLSKESMDELDEIMKTQDHQPLYQTELKSNGFTPRRSGKTWPREGDQDDDISHEDDVVKKVTYHVKLLQFHTNYRPPYYGTWRKSSNVLSAKNPWKKDTALFDYEVDSDDEWEEEEPGESLSSSEEEEEKDDKEDDEDEEDGWMVPHGYLSEGEGCVEDDEVTPEILKARRAANAEKWESQRNQQGLPHKPEYIGCIWDGSAKNDANIFNEYRVTIINGEMPIATSHNRALKEVDPTENKSGNNLKKRVVPEEALPDLIKFVHGSRTGIKKLVVEFQSYWNTKHANMVAKVAQEESKTESSSDITPGTPGEKSDVCKQNSTPNTSVTETDAPEENSIISKRQLEKKILVIAVREKRVDYSKICWYVHNDIRKQYGLEDLPLKDKTSEIKAQEEQMAAAAILQSTKISLQSLPTTLEAKTPNGKGGSNDKPLARPAPSDQMSILSFAQTSDKLSSVRTVAAVADSVSCSNSSSSSNNNSNNGDNVVINDIKDNAKSPAKKPLPRDQMSILNFTKAAPQSSEKTALPSTVKAEQQRREKSVSLKNADSSSMCDSVIVIDDSEDYNNSESKTNTDSKSVELKTNGESKNIEMKEARGEGGNVNDMKPSTKCDSSITKLSVNGDCNDVRPSSTSESIEGKPGCVNLEPVKGPMEDEITPDFKMSVNPQTSTNILPATDHSVSPQNCSSTDVEMVEEPKSTTG
eukprot:XP_014784367.1 PREDICTED: chromatin assembly factor 1 subunit A-like [Octopus bimaculoides]